MSSQESTLEQQVDALARENQAMRAELARYQKRAEIAEKSRKRLMGFGWRVLVPLVDRQKVARSFTKLAGTVSDFAGPPEKWPTREQILLESRTFMTSCVRFVIRRRMFVLLFSLLATTVPAMQMWLVWQQNEIIGRTNNLFETQVNDIIATSLTEGKDPNARRVAGVLLGNLELKLMGDVIHEIFDPLASGMLESRGAGSVWQRLEDAAFRSHLIRAVTRAVGKGGDTDELYEHAQPMIRQILADTRRRLPLVLLMNMPADGDRALAAKIAEARYYVYQVGRLLIEYERLARAADESKRYYRDIKPLMQELARRGDIARGEFALVYYTAMEELLINLELRLSLGTSAEQEEAAREQSGKAPEELVRAGLGRLRASLGEDALDWDGFAKQLQEAQR
jgi:hypothetical protein